MAVTQTLGDDYAEQKQALKISAKAAEAEAKRKLQFEKDANDLRKQPGSLVLSNKSPSQLLNRQATQTNNGAPINIYADPNDWRGKQGVNNPPPVGNIGKQTYTYVPNALARNPYDYASGRGTTEDYEKYEDSKKRSGFTTVYDPRTFTSKIEKGTETDLNSPETQRMLDVAGGFDVGTTDQMKREIAKAQQTGEPVAAQTPGRSPGDFIQVKNMIPKAEFVVPKWHQQVIKNHPTIGKKGSRENNAYVQEYKRKTTLGESFDPVVLADEVMGSFDPGAEVPNSTNPGPVPAQPTVRPAKSKPSYQFPPTGSGNPFYRPDLTPRPVPVTPVPATPRPIATPTPAPTPPAAPATPASEVPYETIDGRYPYQTPETDAYPYQTPELNGVPYSPSGSSPAPIIPTNPLPDGVTLAEDEPSSPSFDPNRPIYGGKSTLPPGYFANIDPNKPLNNPNPINPYAPVIGRLTGNVNPGDPSSYYSNASTDPNETIDLNAVENFDLQNPTKKPIAPQTKRSRPPFVEHELPTSSSAVDTNLFPDDINLYTPVTKEEIKNRKRI